MNLERCSRVQGLSDGGVYRYIYPPKLSPWKLFCALIAAGVVRLLVYRTVVSYSKKLYPPKMNFWLRPWQSAVFLCPLATLRCYHGCVFVCQTSVLPECLWVIPLRQTARQWSPAHCTDNVTDSSCWDEGPSQNHRTTGMHRDRSMQCSKFSNNSWSVVTDDNHAHTHTDTQPFYGPFSRTTHVSRCQKRTSGLYGARED